MVPKTKKTVLFDFYDLGGPKTLKGKGNKMITGDGRKKHKNMSKEETADLINTMLGVPKVDGTKKTRGTKKRDTSATKKKAAKK